jgi:hypothetical protein
MLEKININTSTTREFTQLPGIAKNLAYRIVNHRDRHEFFTHWGELAEVKEFPMNNLDRIKQHATLDTAPDVDPSKFNGPRRVKPAHLQREKRRATQNLSAPRAGKTG